LASDHNNNNNFTNKKKKKKQKKNNPMGARYSHRCRHRHRHHHHFVVWQRCCVLHLISIGTQQQQEQRALATKINDNDKK